MHLSQPLKHVKQKYQTAERNFFWTLWTSETDPRCRENCQGRGFVTSENFLPARSHITDTGPLDLERLQTCQQMIPRK